MGQHLRQICTWWSGKSRSVTGAEASGLLTSSPFKPYEHTVHQKELGWWKLIGFETRGHVSRESSDRHALDSDPNFQPQKKKKKQQHETARERGRQRRGVRDWEKGKKKTSTTKIVVKGKEGERSNAELRKAPLCGLLLSPFTATEAILNASEKKEMNLPSAAEITNQMMEGLTSPDYCLTNNTGSCMNTSPCLSSGCSYQKGQGHEPGTN